MPYRFAIVGCGSVSHRHAAAIQQVGTLASVCDLDLARSKHLGDQYSCPAFTDFPRMLEETRPDIVAICSPSGMHAEHATLAMEMGCDVLCEKPMALSAAAARDMIDTAERLNRRLLVVKQNRYNPPVQLVKSLLDAGRLGEVHGFQLNCCWNRGRDYYLEQPWRGRQADSGGILFTQFSHFLDLLYWFCGDIREVKGWRANFCHQNLIDFEDTGAAVMNMANGSLGSFYYTINAQDRNLEGSITLFGSRGTVKIGGVYLNRIEHFAVEEVKEPTGYDERRINGHEVIYRELVKTVQDASHPFVNAREAMKSIAMIEEIYRNSPILPLKS